MPAITRRFYANASNKTCDVKLSHLLKVIVVARVFPGYLSVPPSVWMYVLCKPNRPSLSSDPDVSGTF